MKVSIITSYFNRKEQLINTLKTIQQSIYVENIEMIIVDDASDKEHRLDDIISKFKFVKLIRIESKDKWYTNPCIPFNIGIKESIGDIIILQNPECLHIGDIINYTINNLTENNYISYGIYSTDEKITKNINNLQFDSKHIFNIIKDTISPINNFSCTSDGGSCWYNHSLYRPVGYHFISAITKNNMNKLNGFDERYSTGIGFDDNEFLFRINKIGLKVEIINEPFGIHQWHYNVSNHNIKPEEISKLVNKNRLLFEMTSKHN